MSVYRNISYLKISSFNSFFILKKRAITKKIRKPKNPLSLPKKWAKSKKNFRNLEISFKMEDYASIPLIPEYKIKKNEFENPIELIVSLKKRFEAFGAVKIVVPKEWLTKKEEMADNCKITVRRQVIQDLVKGKVRIIFKC